MTQFSVTNLEIMKRLDLNLVTNLRLEEYDNFDVIDPHKCGAKFQKLTAKTPDQSSRPPMPAYGQYAADG